MNNLRRRLFTQEEVMRLGVDVVDVPIGTTIKGLWMPINILNGGNSVLFLLSIDTLGYTAEDLYYGKIVYNNKNGNQYSPLAYIIHSDGSVSLYVSYNSITTSNLASSDSYKYILFNICSPIVPGTTNSSISAIPAGSISSLYIFNSMFYGDDNTYYVYINFEPLCILSTNISIPPTPTTVTLKTKPSESKQIYCVTA